jgi:hypothetical protein
MTIPEASVIALSERVKEISRQLAIIMDTFQGRDLPASAKYNLSQTKINLEDCLKILNGVEGL